MRGFSRGMRLPHTLQLYDFCGILELTIERKRRFGFEPPTCAGYIRTELLSGHRVGNSAYRCHIFPNRLTRTWANKGNFLKPECLFSDTDIRTANERDKANFPLQKLPDECVGCF